MCYSVLLRTQLKKISEEFNAAVDKNAWIELYLLRKENPELKIPFGLDRHFVLSKDPADARLAAMAREFVKEEVHRTHKLISTTEEEISELSSGKQTAANKKKMEVRERRLEKLKYKVDLSFDRISPLDDRVYPGSFAPVILSRNGERLIVPMRYRVRRPDGEEVPSQYNVFNARRDSLQNAPTWKPLFGHTHGIFPFVKFYEWVEREGAKKEISFTPDNRNLMWAASLFSEPNKKAALNFRSFAMVTDEPPPEVAEAGHDRCPIFLQESLIDQWLQPQKKPLESLNELLSHKEKTIYFNSLVA